MNARAGDPLLGSILDDRYRIVRRIARGGMATVFEAQDLRLARTVAVKVMHPGLDEDGDIARRFNTEARATALLSHPNVVAVFDQGHDAGRPYIVMEYVRGITLRQLISLEAPFPPEQALGLFEPVVAALASAHDAGLIHRDVKPENVLISERGRVKVADFGLAREVTAASVAEGGVVIGTVSYIAPELVSRGHASARSDVYSLGILLYELLTGCKPHRGATPIEVAYAHVHRSVPVPSAAAKTAGPVPGFLDELVRTTTTRTPAHRQADAGVLLRQVRAARSALTTGDTSSAALRALMHATTDDEATQAARRTPGLVGAGSVPPAQGPRPLPGLREIRLAPSPAASPGVAEDGPPYFADGATARSPYSPQPRGSVPRPSSWVQTPTHRRRRLGVAVAALLLVVALVYGGWWVSTGRLPATPQVAGMSQADAQATLRSAGLEVSVQREYSESVPAGIVLRTDPATGARLEPGTVVLAYVSQGPQLFDVPTLSGKKRAQALRALASAHLTAGSVTEAYDESVPAGAVVSQSVVPGTGLRRDSAVSFVVSLGREPITLADWSGHPAAKARRALLAQHLRVRLTYRPWANVAKGTVIRQTPEPGTLHRGDIVTLVISTGAGNAAVPDVRRMDPASAAATLQAAGFVVKVAAAPQAATIPGTITQSSPVVGSTLKVGSTVTILVG